MKRRSLLAGAGGLGLASLSGCLGVVGLDEHEATPAGVREATRTDTGYELTGVEPLPVEEDVGPAGILGTVRVENALTEHEKRVEIPLLGSRRAAVFLVLATPTITVAGRNLNPVEEMTTAELVDLVENNYDEIGDVSHSSDEEVTILGQPTTASAYAAEAVFDGVDVDVNLHVTEAVESGDDLVVAIGVYPRHAEAFEADNVRSLMESVIEDFDPADADEDSERTALLR